ncbi:hypothetical protein K439DRAFT_1618797 [Ramaria rubella]|nr:hypothetical protein K439DRAFT_1618797 [Ramaria rubella]
MAPSVPTGTAQDRFKYCACYFKNLNGHYAQSKACGDKQRHEVATQNATLVQTQAAYAARHTDASQPAYLQATEPGPSQNILNTGPKTPERPGPSKRPRFFSPDHTGPGPAMDDNMRQSSMFPAETCEPPLTPPQSSRVPQTGSGMPIYEMRPFPDASTTYGHEETTFEHIWRTWKYPETPDYPFKSHAEWSMVEWLGTSGISNTQIDSLLQTDF